MPEISYTPGVYVKEVQTGTRPIQAVGTSTAGFIGQAPNGLAYVGEARYITSWNQFQEQFFPKPREKTEDERKLEEKEREKGSLDAKIQAVTRNQSKLKAQQDAETETAKKAKLGEELAAITKELQTVNNELAAAETEVRLLADQIAAKKLEAITNLESQISLETGNPLKKAILEAELQIAKKEAELYLKAVVEKTALQKKINDPEGDDKKNLQRQFDNAQYVANKNAAQAAAQRMDEELKKHPDYPWTFLAHAVFGFFLNGGSACYVLNLGKGVDGTEIAGLDQCLDALNRVDEIAILAAPGYDDQFYASLRDTCDRLGDRVAILDGPSKIDSDSLVVLGSGGKVETTGWEMPLPSERGMATLYVPWLNVANPNPLTNKDKKFRTVLVPPSGHIAGIWARSDANRGVHKAPANEVVRGALSLEYRISDTEQSNLNKNGVNCIRYFTGEGNIVWGARTLSKDPLWNYLNVRRLFNQIEESILKGTRWIVFEPNDRPLWQAIKRDVTAFLMGYWRSGALMGKTPEEAFYVKCDEQNNPFEEIILGRVHIDIGIAPVRPAEFVIFQISQYEAGSEVKVSGA